MPTREKVKVTLSLDVDALELLNKAISVRKRGWYVSVMLRRALASEVTVSEVIATLRAFEGTLQREYSCAQMESDRPFAYCVEEGNRLTTIGAGD